MDDERHFALIEADRRRLVRAAARLLGQAEAEDAVQEAYVRGLEAKALELNVAQAWLLTVVRNLAIDRLRRRDWLQQWVKEMTASNANQVQSSAEESAAHVQEANRLLRLLAGCLAPAEGAAVLLHEVFEASHLEIAEACGKTEATCRQQMRRALLRLRQVGLDAVHGPNLELDSNEEDVFSLYVKSLQLRDPRGLWAMLRQPPIRAFADPVVAASSVPHTTTSGVVQVGGQLGLVLSLDGVVLCVLPLGARTGHELTDELV